MLESHMNNKGSTTAVRGHVCGEEMQEQLINQDFWGNSPRLSNGASRATAPRAR